MFLPTRKGFQSGALALFISLPIAAGCDGVVGSDEGSNVSISFAGPAASGMARSLSGSSTAAEVSLLEVELTFSEVTLERAEGGLGGDSDGDSDTDSDSDGPNNEVFRSGPVTLDLPLDGGVITPFAETVPSGVYEEIELDLASIRFRGNTDGEPFDFVLPFDTELEMDFEPLLEVTDGSEPFNVTVVIDSANWFDGIDPLLIEDNDDLQDQLKDRIESSFDAFEDSDRDADDSDSDSDSDR